MRDKVFGIGLPKTGTTTLHSIFKQAGYKAIHYPIRQMGKLSTFDFACDQPICNIYQDLHTCYPTAHFIYTDRNIDDWLESCRCHWERGENALTRRGADGLAKMQTFGTVFYKPDIFRKVYIEHKRSVLDFFKEKKLIVINICENIGMDQLWPIIGTKLETIPKLNSKP